MSNISSFYNRLRPVLGGSYALIVLFMFLPFMVVSCGSGDSRRVLAEQNGAEFLLFELPQVSDQSKAQQNEVGIYVMGGVAWLILLTAVLGLVLVVKNGNLKRAGVAIGSVGTLFALIFMGFVLAGDAKMKEDMASASEFGAGIAINIEIGSGLMMIFIVYLATLVFAALQKMPALTPTPGNLRLEDDTPPPANENI